MTHVTFYKKGKVWWMQYRINGTRIRKSLSTKVESIAKRKATTYEQNLTRGEGEDFRGRTKLASFWPEYLAYAQSCKRPKTVYNDRIFWSRFYNWLEKQGVKYVDQINSPRFESYRIYLQEQRLNKTSINIVHRHISSILSFAVRMGFIMSNPIKRIKQYVIEPKTPKFLSREEIFKITKYAEIHSKEIHMIIALGIYAGFRKSEIANARWEWFDLENNVVVIQPFGNFIPKSHRSRPIPLNQNLKEILLRYRQSKGFLLNSNVVEEDRKNLIRFDFKRAFGTVKRNAGLMWITPHILRHTFASQLALSCVSLYKIQQWLGHSDPKTTMIYAHLQVQDEEINLI